MFWLLVSFAIVSGGAFIFYGFETLFAEPPRGEYERFGMPQLRQLVGTMQMLGGVGVLMGLAYAPIGVAAAAGLTVLMILGLLTRLRVHDGPRLMIPAGTYAVINATLIVLFLMR